MRALVPIRIGIDTRTKEGSISFLKKRNKKLLTLAPGSGAKWVASALAATDKSFLVLFFKKELLSWRLTRLMTFSRGAAT
ncbi:MAG TPA: hypothetical protein VMB71_14160 [Acetobacteraceae bacterium]|nr:hypothetical protein [Acetobacteraceae bacterium]